MPRWSVFLLVLSSTIVCTLVAALRLEAAGDDPTALFEQKIRPVLEGTCVKCHGATKTSGGLRLDTRRAILAGGDTGPAVEPGDPENSLLVQAIRHEGGLAMPPKKPKLSESTVADFVTWVRLGAPDPRTGPAASPSEAAGPTFADEARRHWSFQPVRKPVPPNVKDGAWATNPVDAFILAQLEQRGWHPAPPASRSEWIRRVSFDLTGLPPTPEDVDAFVADASPEAYERVADRLLRSPQYGERWAQHWLDVVRFAETEGFEYDRHIPDAWRYRDYVIDALNRDKPFDRFVVEQIAGDEVAPQDPECLAATTFHRLGPVRRNAGNPDIALSRNEVLTERTDIIGSAFLGLTVGCARCHNHKLEPIAQKDYYRLQAYMAATEEHNIALASAEEQASWEAKSETFRKEVARLKKEAKGASGDELTRLTARIDELEDQMPPPLATIPSTWNDFSQRTEIHVLKRGVWENKGEAVGPRPLGVLLPDDEPELPAGVNDPRTRLAHWLVAPSHPLTARVFVNRIWQQHFGAGLVRTVNDFGVKGDRPSHPELLDWLAATFVENGWHVKPIHRLLVLSNTYRQSSRAPLATAPAQSDPENRFLWRFNRRRLSAEEIRDAMLAVAGRLNLEAGGPSVMIPVDPGLVRLLYKPTQWQVAASRGEHDRRSIYLIAKRNLRLPFFETFDAPALLTSCARRESSTHAPQALEMLNGALSNDLAAAFAGRLEHESGGDRARLVAQAFRRALGRPPTEAEQALGLEFLRDQTAKEFALAMFNLNGFLYVP
jgi:mono/diheme cytochrome c family protein